MKKSYIIGIIILIVVLGFIYFVYDSLNEKVVDYTDIVGKYINNDSGNNSYITLNEDGTCSVTGYYVYNTYITIFGENAKPENCRYKFDNKVLTISATIISKNKKMEINFDCNKGEKSFSSYSDKKFTIVDSNSQNNNSNNNSDKKLSCSKSDVDNIINLLNT